jgi:hypothetical protein
MARRSVATLMVIALAAPSVAVAQQQPGGSNPFGPLPQPPPQQAPEPPAPQPVDPGAGGNDDGLGGTAFWLIIGTTGAIFAAIAFFITRDMRRTVGTRRKPRKLRGTGRPAADAAEALASDVRHRPGSHKARAKAQQRAKTKAARKQRRKTRSRSR